VANSSGRAVGDFSALRGTTAREVLQAIPAHATTRKVTPIPGAVQEGIEYKWVDGMTTWRVRIHGPDTSAPAGSNAAQGWVVRIQKGHLFMDAAGNFYPRGVHNPASPHYNAGAANDTHIPIQTPSGPRDYTR
jgi:Bacterial toxin 30